MLKQLASNGGRRLAAKAARRGGGSRQAAAISVPAGEKAQSDGYSLKAVLAVGTLGALGGVAAGDRDSSLRRLSTPGGGFRACCDAVPLTERQQALPGELDAIVGSRNVKRNVTQKGSRLGKGTAMAVVSPGTLAEAVKVLKACVAADVAIIPQGANTALTGASVPRDTLCDRPTVVVNMRRLKKIMPIGEDGKQVLCQAGAGIFDLQDMMMKKYNRDSHTVLGSIFLNPSVAAGVAFGSGGTQIRKGPAFTERALYLKVTKGGEVELVNTLGLKDGGDAVGMLDGRTELKADDVDERCKSPASWPNYREHLVNFDGEVSRFNADTRGLDCNRSEGKVMILATVHDSFEMPKKTKVIWVACKDFATAHELKRLVCLSSPSCMAKSCEYLNRDTFDAVDKAGRVLVKMIDVVGMRRLEPLWNLKLMVEMVPLPFTNIICDKFLWWMNNMLPESMPKVLMDLGRSYDHHMLIEFAEYADGEVDALQKRLDDYVASKPSEQVTYHVCQEGAEKTRATLFRFAVAPAFRTYVIGRGMQGLSIDYALPKNHTAYPALPEDKYPFQSGGRLVYSHFGCNVFHEDFIFGPEVDVEEAKMAIKHAIEHEGGKLPAEHGHGTEYKAPEETRRRWMNMDPGNVMNPGVGGLSNYKGYSATPVHACDCVGHGSPAAAAV